jgi:glycosyltransferase involved in cell wall biosynthesis
MNQETLNRSEVNKITVVVVQIGARRNYAVPIALERAGMLARFYTDWYTPKSTVTRVISTVSEFLPFRWGGRAAARTASELDLGRVVHFPKFAIEYKIRKKLAARKKALPKAYIWGGQAFCNAVVKSGLPPSDVVFCFSSAGKEIFEQLQGSRTLRVLDQGIPPLRYDDRLVREQELAYPDWVTSQSLTIGVDEYTQRQREEWKYADLILCPSRFCQRGLLEEGAPAEKIQLLPFGIHERFFSVRSRIGSGGPLRVLFVGNTPVRKGLPDLVLALEALNSPHLKGVFVGELSGLRASAIQRAMRFGNVLGPVPRPKMREIYQNADVFVLPTVSDVFPAVVLEAMAAGLPVIVTANCGSADAVRDGIDGFIVPIRSPQVIAEKLDLLVRNPELREEMGRNAAEQAKKYSLEAYRQRLVQLLSENVPLR